MSSTNRPDIDLEVLFGPKAKNGKALDETLGDEPQDEPAPAPSKPSLIPPPARAALQRLLARGVLLSRNHREEYGQLMAWRNVIAQILDSMGLSMQLHEDYGLAVLMRNEDVEAAQSDEEGDDAEDEEGSLSLVRTTRLKLLHSLVLMVLRMYYRERERAGDEQVIIDLDSLKDRLKPYWPLLHAEGRSDKQFNGAIRKLQDHGILLRVRGKDEQRHVSPVIMLALDSERLEIMVSEYSKLAGVSPPQDDE